MSLFDFTGNEASLYLHIPFCAGSCAYCDFYSMPVPPTETTETGALLDRYVDALARDLARLPERLRIPTVYIGGGTPSILGHRRMGRLLAAVQGILRQSVKTCLEITVEANPESVTEPFLRACLDHGVTRVSIGAQSFHEPSRKAVGRIGSGLQRGLSLARDYFSSGPGGFSVDIMTGLPLQDEAVLDHDIAKAISYHPNHVSLYALTPENLPAGTLNALPDPDKADALWIRGRDALRSGGYEQYEVSNFSLKPHTVSRHNIRYWRMESWIGLGAAASSTLIDERAGTARRFTFAPDSRSYIRGVPPDREVIDTSTLIQESVLMGFRYKEGPSQALFRRRFGAGIHDVIPRTLASWQEKGFLNAGKTALTLEGLLFLNRFLRDAFAELAYSLQG